ncbi:MAG: ABC transporter permease [Thermoleophilia bacterium]|nr:ABC transporter permease [Thermoleophilia bacterium]
MSVAPAYARFAPLYRNLVKREVRQRYKGSLFGLAWTLMNPVVVVLTYSVVFNFLFEVQKIPYYPLFLFTGLTAWTFFFGGIQMAASSLVANGNLVKKVRFPREIVPAAAISANAVTGAAMLAIALPLSLVLHSESPLPLVLLPVLLVALGALTLGVGLTLAALNVYFRDVEHILGAIGMPWFFLTPIFYTLDQLPESLQARPWLEHLFYYGNPATPYVSSFRDVVFSGRWPSAIDVAYCIGVGAVALGLGFLAFRRLERDLAIEL